VNLHNRLSLPAKAVLLIARSLQDDFILPTEKGKDWYGLSRDTMRKGLRDLRLYGLLSMSERSKAAPLSALGFTMERRYRLHPPLARDDAPRSPPRAVRKTRPRKAKKSPKRA
jgi:hypothetical protein